MKIPDLYAEGIARGWKVQDARTLKPEETIEADVAVIGSGAGGGLAARVLSEAGLHVVLLEDGPLWTSADLRKLDELAAYSNLYANGGASLTADLSIAYIQGRAVGGGTLVNWTASFRVPDEMLRYWSDAHGIRGLSPAELEPWYASIEKQLHATTWETQPNRNNDLIRIGAEKLGWHWGTMKRNVHGCANLGYCGFGCPIDAKQSTRVNAIPAALERGARLVYNARAERFEHGSGKVSSLGCRVRLEHGEYAPGGLNVRARHYVLAAGGVGTPAVLLRSKVPDPRGLIGRRTFLHPTVQTRATFETPVDGFYGAPQSLYSDQFVSGVPEQRMGYAIEAVPVHPAWSARALTGMHAEQMRELSRTQNLIALLRDGFHDESQGGEVRLHEDGTANLNYEWTPYLQDGMRRGLLSLVELQFAAGARAVRPEHAQARSYTSWTEARQAVSELPLRKQLVRIATAHVLGGCAMGSDADRSVTDSDGKLHAFENLSVFDGSLFPTGFGVNPAITISAVSAMLSARLAKSLKKG